MNSPFNGLIKEKVRLWLPNQNPGREMSSPPGFGSRETKVDNPLAVDEKSDNLDKELDTVPCVSILYINTLFRGSLSSSLTTRLVNKLLLPKANQVLDYITLPVCIRSGSVVRKYFCNLFSK